MAVSTCNDRFHFINQEEINELMDSADSKNTKQQIRYGLKIFEDYIKLLNIDLNNADALNNSDLDDLLGKFYVGARRQNGELYSKTSMVAIRFALQRHFLKNKREIINSEDFSNSTRIFKCFLATLKKEGKGAVRHKEPISSEDMTIIQRSLDMDDPLGLQNKVFLDIMLHFCNRGRENLREMKRDSFYLIEANNGKRSVVIKDTMTKNNREKDAELSQGGNMVETNQVQCPVNSFLIYLDKLHPDCEWFWQCPKKIKPVSGPWYKNAPIGKNTIGDKMRKISLKAGVKLYTNHCLRATSVTILNNAGFNNRDIMTVSGHHAETSIQNYARTTESKKEEMSNVIAAAINPQDVEFNLDEILLYGEISADPAIPGQENTVNNVNITNSQEKIVNKSKTFNIQNCVVNFYN